MAPIDIDYLTNRFESLRLDSQKFGHAEHLAVAVGMLQKYEFLDAVKRFSDVVRVLAAEAGAPEKYCTTTTLAFMALVAERIEHHTFSSHELFIAGNQDLLSRNVLNHWYSPERLNSSLARRVFLMPDQPTR